MGLSRSADADHGRVLEVHPVSLSPLLSPTQPAGAHLEVFIVGHNGADVGGVGRHSKNVGLTTHSVLGVGVDVVIQQPLLAPHHHHETQVKLAQHGITCHHHSGPAQAKVVQELAPCDGGVPTGAVCGLKFELLPPVARDGALWGEVAVVVAPAAALAAGLGPCAVHEHEGVGAPICACRRQGILPRLWKAALAKGLQVGGRWVKRQAQEWMWVGIGAVEGGIVSGNNCVGRQATGGAWASGTENCPLSLCYLSYIEFTALGVALGVVHQHLGTKQAALWCVHCTLRLCPAGRCLREQEGPGQHHLRRALHVCGSKNAAELRGAKTPALQRRPAMAWIRGQTTEVLDFNSAIAVRTGTFLPIPHLNAAKLCDMHVPGRWLRRPMGWRKI